MSKKLELPGGFQFEGKFSGMATGSVMRLSCTERDLLELLSGAGGWRQGAFPFSHVLQSVHGGAWREYKRLTQEKFTPEARESVFLMRTVKHRKWLPREIILFPFLEVFKS